MNGGGQMRPLKHNAGYFIVNYPWSTCPMDLGANSDQMFTCVEFQSPLCQLIDLHAKDKHIKNPNEKQHCWLGFFFIKERREFKFLKCAPPDSKWKNNSGIYEPKDEVSPLSFAETCKHLKRIRFIKCLLGLTFVLKQILLADKKHRNWHKFRAKCIKYRTGPVD